MKKAGFKPVGSGVIRGLLGGIALMGLAACEAPKHVDAEEEFEVTNAVDQTGINEIMLSLADPGEAVSYFRRALTQEPDRVDFKIGYAKSLARDRRYGEARLVFLELDAADELTPNDRVEFAAALARLDEWDAAKEQLAKLPPSYESPREALLNAMAADNSRDWAQADLDYENAAKIAAQPARIYNNWGMSKLARGDMEEAERLFERALIYDPDMFSAKNNLALAYGLQRSYRVPLVTLTDEERAILLNNLAVLALRQGDVDVAKGLLTRAIDIHPRHYTAAIEKLNALETQVNTGAANTAGVQG